MIASGKACLAAFALSISVTACLVGRTVLAGATQPAATAPDEAGRREAEQLKERAARRLSRLAEYLEQQAAIATTDATTVRNAVTTNQPAAAMSRSLDSANSSAKSVIARQASEETFAQPADRSVDPKIVGGGVVAAIDEKASTYRDYAGHLKDLSVSLAADAPDQALLKIDQAYVPPDVQQVLQQETGERPRMRALSATVDTNGSEPTPLQVYATGSGRVVGTGARASIDFPSVVAILQDQSSDPTPQFAPWCSGTLIAPNAVLTAAHCFCTYSTTQEYSKASECKTKKFQLLNGSQRETSDPSFRRIFFQHGGIREIERIEINDQFDFPFADLAVVILKEPITDVSPVAFNATAPVANGTLGTVAGFGRHSLLDQLGGPITEYAGNDVGLKFVAKIMTGACAGNHANKNLICWHFSNPTLPQSVRDGGNTCNGDSGGPLLAEVGAQVALVGVTSGGMLPDCGPGDDSFDVDVFAFKDWVAQKLSAHQAPNASATRPSLHPLDQNPGRYHFAKSTWQFNAQSQFFNWPITIPSTVQWLRVSVNTNRVLQNPVRLQIVNDSGDLVRDANGNPICNIETEDSAASCEVENHSTAPWRIATSGPGSRWFQIVATGF